jgi:hypothetical protein
MLAVDIIAPERGILATFPSSALPPAPGESRRPRAVPDLPFTTCRPALMRTCVRCQRLTTGMERVAGSHSLRVVTMSRLTGRCREDFHHQMRVAPVCRIGPTRHAPSYCLLIL